ncbi:AraC family transcriptional regulator [Sphingomonas sp. CFBP 13733]|uniref:AraC family transcriptional regulator n=1 Tax=Sphingomonas sp. CFBP 13733 TaxID=2775291 RepID=UPI00177ED130|nr:helix-turn-helix domain-containing protein [Sphingomonas sp. CFBP 13733]MBD8640925.1 helix-turn-helix domain-containing protein [Sphingomonas sp. CFBP 13733]
MDVMQVSGGTNRAGLAPDVFAMPAGMAIRYDQPCDALTDLITGYHVYRATGPASIGQVNRFLPGTANVRFAFEAGPISVAIGRRTFGPLPAATLYGPTGTALKATTNGGVMIGFGVSALAWSRLFNRSAAEYRDRIVPLADALGPVATQRLTTALRAAERDDQVAPILDAILCDLLGPPHCESATIRQLTRLIGQDGGDDVAAVAAKLAISPDTLRRLAVRHFGFTPKMLLRRARFLRSFLRVFRTPGGTDYSAIDPSYFDVSHFLRDAGTFLGMTPRRFMAMSTPFLDASVRARAAVLGAPTQALQVPAETSERIISAVPARRAPKIDTAPDSTPTPVIDPAEIPMPDQGGPVLGA